MPKVIEKSLQFLIRSIIAALMTAAAAFGTAALWGWLDGDPETGLLVVGFVAGNVWAKMIEDT